MLRSAQVGAAFDAVALHTTYFSAYKTHASEKNKPDQRVEKTIYCAPTPDWPKRFMTRMDKPKTTAMHA